MIHLPDAPFERYRAIYEALEADRSWLEPPGIQRFAALTAVTTAGEPDEVARAIAEVAEGLKAGAGWFSDLTGPFRVFVSAGIARDAGDPAAYSDDVERVRALFREIGLRRGGGPWETAAIVVLRRSTPDATPVDRARVERFGAIYEAMKKHHFWLTGPEDFPAAALLVDRPGDPDVIGDGIEAVYQALRERGFPLGDPLQTAANLLAAADLDPRHAADRFQLLAERFRDADVSIWQADYDELALLAHLRGPVEPIVERTIAIRALVRELRPRPGILETFALGAGLTFIERIGHDELDEPVTDPHELDRIRRLLTTQAAHGAVAAATQAAS